MKCWKRFCQGTRCCSLENQEVQGLHDKLLGEEGKKRGQSLFTKYVFLTGLFVSVLHRSRPRLGALRLQEDCAPYDAPRPFAPRRS